jgi:hypothetical protein
VTQADVDAGQVNVTATANGTGPQGPQAGVAGSTTATIPRIQQGPTNAEVEASFKNLVGAFMTRRMDRMLENEPDANRMKNRGLGQPQVGMVANLEGTGSSLDGGFSMSFQGMRSRILQLDGEVPPSVEEGGLIERFDLWAEGRFNSLVNQDEDKNHKGQFGILHTGIDYRVSEGLLLGLMASFDWMDEDVDEINGEVSGHGWMAGPYISARLSEHLFFDGRVSCGRSDNEAKQDIMGLAYKGDFETERWLAKATLSGAWEFDRLLLSPEIGVSYIEEKQDAYDVKNSGNVVDVDGQEVSLGRLTVAQEIGYRYGLEDLQLMPYVRASLHWDFKEAESFVLVDESDALDELRGAGEVGLRMQSDRGIAGSLAINYDGLFGDDVEAFGVKGAITIPFR